MILRLIQVLNIKILPPIAIEFATATPLILTGCECVYTLTCLWVLECAYFSGSRFEQTSAKIRLPDDCTVGFIVEERLGISMVHCPLFHSHLENLLLISHRNIPHQALKLLLLLCGTRLILDYSETKDFITTTILSFKH